MREGRERRKSIRVRSLNLVYINPEKTSSVIYGLGRTLELSLEGATLEVVDKLSVGADIELELAMGETLVTLKGHVKNVRPSKSGFYRVGIQFLTPSTVRLV